MPDRYLIITAMRGYLPETDPYVFTCDPDRAAVPQVLECLRDEIERAEPMDSDSPEADRWQATMNEIEGDLERAADLSPEGFCYDMPDRHSYIDATLKSDAELTKLGYELEEA